MKTIDPINPPNKPEYVFLGLIVGRIFGPPNVLPTIKAIESLIITPANNKKVNGELKRLSILLK